MRKIFTLLILLLLLPVTALAVEGAPNTLYVGDKGLSVANDSYWTTDANGKLTQSAADQSWNVKYDPSTATLTLKGANITGNYHQYYNPHTAGIYALCSSNQPVALTIELIGTNTITGHYGIYVNAEQGQTVGTNASLLIQNSGDNGILEVSGSSDGIYVKSGTGNASLTINDASVVAKTTQTYSGGHAGVYVQSSIRATSFPQLSLAVNGGSLTTSASEGNDGIQFYVGLFQATGDTTNLTVSDNAIVRANGGIKAYHVDEPTPSGTGIVFDGTEGTVYGNVTLQEDITIGEGESLTIGNGASLNTGSYEVIVNGGTLDGVDKITGTVKYAPAITTQPTSQTVTEGETATFTVEASGTELLSYQWQQSTDNGNSWTNIDSANAAEYATGQTTTSMNGYQYRCMVSNSVGSVESNAATLTVTPVPVTGVSLDKITLELFTGNTATLTATVHPDNATNKDVTWSSDNADVATVDNGTVTAVGAGEATITVQTQDGNYTASCTVTVTKPEEPKPPIDQPSYYNIYVEDVCDGVEVTTSKNVVREGGSISLYVEKDTANYTFDNFKVYYKRSYYGPWEVLEEGVQPGEYPINNIWTHIYIKAEGAEEKEDPTGIESIEGVKVYTKDGSLYVQTPQREQVIIVSMTGAVVKNEEQIGLKQYHGLQPGIYIVRVGDRAYKLRLN